MSIVKMSSLLDDARKHKRGCGSFSVYSMEVLIGTLKAAEELQTPIIIQLAEGRFKTAPLELMGAMMVNAAKTAQIDVAVHLDHGKTLETVKRALELGFTSVMFDGSALPFEENIEKTSQMIQIAKTYSASTEAELGLVGVGEGGERDYGIKCTVPEDAKAFVERTQVGALAVAIGNAHGNYPVAPKLRFDILKDIHALIPDEHLVLHGGSGISDGDFQECIRNGITKINVATALLNGAVSEGSGYLSQNTKKDYYGLSAAMVKGAYEVAKHHIQVFNMK